MLSIVQSIGLHGLEGYLINVEVDTSAGLPSFDIVGLPDVSVKESKERVRTAIKNSGLNFESRKIIVNLSPANTRNKPIKRTTGKIRLLIRDVFTITLFKPC